MATTSTDAPTTTDARSEAHEEHVRYAIIGAGFGGLAAGVRLERDLDERDFVIFERNPEAGGCWWANQYPGAQCDIPSHLYSLSFEPNPNWSRSFGLQGEIRDYLVSISHKYGLRDRIRFSTTVTDARWDDARSLWVLETTGGIVTSNYLIAAPGPLSDPIYPDIPGFDEFKGHVMHTARWNHDVDLDGKRVAVVGTGASAIQAVPQLAKIAKELTVYQRTPPWIVPHTDRPIPVWERKLLGRLPLLQRIRRDFAYIWREMLIPGMVYAPVLQKGIEALANNHRERSVSDPALRKRLTPSYRLGCKRILPSNKWYPALQRENVELVDGAVTELTETGIRSADGTTRELDAIVFATGFHVTDIPIAEHVRGRSGKTLAEKWDGSPQAYKGITVPDFPNMFFLVGPYTGLGTNSIVFMIEAQLNYIVDAIAQSGRGSRVLEVTDEALERFGDRMQQKLKRSVWTTGGCGSWYIDAKGRVTTLWPDFTFRYWQQTRQFDRDAYTIEPAPVPSANA